MPEHPVHISVMTNSNVSPQIASEDIHTRYTNSVAGPKTNR